MLNIALPKGRLGEKVYTMFEKSGFECPQIKENNRKLIFEHPEKGIRYLWWREGTLYVLTNDAFPEQRAYS